MIHNKIVTTGISMLTLVIGLGFAPQIVSAQAQKSPIESKIVKIVPNHRSGIAGYILLYPNCGVIVKGGSCPEKPYIGPVTLKTSDGLKIVRHFSTNSDGSFKVTVKPGKYLLAVDIQNTYFHPGTQLQAVTVVKKTITKITMHVSGGIPVPLNTVK